MRRTGRTGGPCARLGIDKPSETLTYPPRPFTRKPHVPP